MTTPTPNPSSSQPPPAPTPPSSTSTTPPTPPLRPIFLTLLLACPLLMLLPPRKLDLYTFSLAGAWVVSAEELTFGSSAVRRGPPIPIPVFSRDRGGQQIDGAKRTDGEGGKGDRLEEGKGKGYGNEGRGDGDGEGEGEGEGVKGLAKKLWMGDERPGWQKRRLERERAELEQGKSYGDIIMEQVRVVFPGFGGGRGRRTEDDGDG